MQTTQFTIHNVNYFKQQMLSWANQFNICCFLDNNQYSSPYHQYECLLAVGEASSVVVNKQTPNALQLLQQYFKANNGKYIFGHAAYELWHHLYHTTGERDVNNNFDDAYFFVPKTVLSIQNNTLTIYGEEVDMVYENIHQFSIPKKINANTLNILATQTKQAYVEAINTIRQCIKKGDFYELNYCQNFYANHAVIDAVATFNKLQQASATPFAAFYKNNYNYLLCASPERYVQKQNTTIISQPIKGTVKRDINNKIADEALAKKLQTCSKEISENVMVVDLVRNDLSIIANPKTVQVPELLGLYSFPQVHQLISTIKATVDEHINFAKVLEHSFPMGSMTGAPKLNVMKTIQQLERLPRGIFSGTVGYITPENNFDFNVVIRSIMYNSQQQYLSYKVGSGITWNSQPQQEYEECLLKAKAMEMVISAER